MLNGIFNKLIQHPRNLFLVDGIGALISALLLVVLIAPMEPIFGMPKNIAFKLSVPAFLFMCYSLSCYFLNVRNRKFFLKLIAIANLMYCGITLSCIIRFYSTLTTSGVLYFLAEILVILVLVWIEFMSVKKSG